MSKVFISYHQRDSKLAEELRAALEQVGVSVWMDKSDVKPGENWRTAVMDAVRSADLILALVGTTESASSSWMSYELGFADAVGKPALLLYSNRHRAEDLPSELSTLARERFDPRAVADSVKPILQRLEELPSAA